MTDKRIKGNIGEKAVANYLKQKKFQITYTNFYSKYGEIDVIAENNELILFVEVKTRSAGQMLSPSFSVDYKKRQRIFRTANLYMQSNKVDKQPRFDIAEVIINSNGKLSINYIDNAFQQESDYAAF